MFCPKVSVVIPTFNSKESLGDAIDSCLSQTYRKLEIIVVDDGSTDNTEDFIINNYNNVIFIKTENRGAASARNVGVSIASGQYIQFLDSDDCLLKDAVSKKVQNISSDTKITVCDKQVDFEGYRDSLPQWWQSSEFSLEFMIEYGTPSTLAPLHFRQNILDIGGFDESLKCCQEYDLHLRLFLFSGVRFSVIDSVGSRVRVRTGSVSRSGSLKILDSQFLILKKIYSDIDVSDLSVCKKVIDSFHRKLESLVRLEARSGNISGAKKKQDFLYQVSDSRKVTAYRFAVLNFLASYISIVGLEKVLKYFSFFRS